jgi:Tol biopolymer transport system component
MISRRTFAKGAAGATILAAGHQFRTLPSARAQQAPPGKIAFGRSGDIWRWQNGETANIFEDGAASDPRWSPQGSDLLYVRTGDSFSDLHVRYLGSGEDIQLTYNQPEGPQGTEEYANNSSWAIDPYWASTGLIAFSSDYFTASSSMMLFLIASLDDGAYLAPSAQSEDNIDSVTLSSDGLLAGYTVRSSDVNNYNVTYIALRDLSDGVAYPIQTDNGAAFDPAISPDNQSVAFSIRSAESDQSDIWLVNRSTGDLRQVTKGAQATSPCWCPDGSWLAYVRMVDYNFEIWAATFSNDEFGSPQKLAGFNDIDAPGGLSWSLAP